jgi:hypothetical protein
MVGTKGPNAKTYRAFARRPGICCCRTANSTMSMQNVARFDRNGKSKCTPAQKKGSAQDVLVMEKARLWLLFSQK